MQLCGLPQPPVAHRAMVQHDCEVKAVLGQAVISLKSMEERDNVVAILLLTEVSPSLPTAPCHWTPSRPTAGQADSQHGPSQFLHSPEVFQYASRKKLDNLLSQGLGNCNQLVRAMSLKGLSSVAMHPKKVRGELWGGAAGHVCSEDRMLHFLSWRRPLLTNPCCRPHPAGRTLARLPWPDAGAEIQVPR